MIPWLVVAILALPSGSLLGWLFGCGWRGTGTFIALIALALANCVVSRDGWRETIG